MVGTDGFEPPCLLEPGLQPGAIGLSATSPCTCTRQRPRAGLLELSPASSGRRNPRQRDRLIRKNVPGPLQGLSSRGKQTGSPPGHQVWKHAVVVRIPSHANPLHNHDQAQKLRRSRFLRKRDRVDGIGAVGPIPSRVANAMSVTTKFMWCPRPDSNRHAFRH